MKLVYNKMAKQIRDEFKLHSGMNFHYKLFSPLAEDYIEKDGFLVPDSPSHRSYNLFESSTMGESLSRAKEKFGVQSFFHTQGKYLYKTFCLEFEGYYFFIHLHRVRGDGIDTNCVDSEIYYRFLIKLLQKAGHDIPDDFFKEHLNPQFFLGHS